MNIHLSVQCIHILVLQVEEGDYLNALCYTIGLINGHIVLFVQEHVAFIAEQDLENPHIKYFEHLNPEWNKVRKITDNILLTYHCCQGHCLVCMARMSWMDSFNGVLKVIRRTWYGHKAGTTVSIILCVTILPC